MRLIRDDEPSTCSIFECSKFRIANWICFCLPSWCFQKWIFKFNQIREIRKFIFEIDFSTVFNNCYFYSVSLKVPIWNVLYLERWMTLKRTWIENEANLNWQSKLEAKLKFASKLSESESWFSRVKIAFGSVKLTFQV